MYLGMGTQEQLNNMHAPRKSRRRLCSSIRKVAGFTQHYRHFAGI